MEITLSRSVRVNVRQYEHVEMFAAVKVTNSDVGPDATPEKILDVALRVLQDSMTEQLNTLSDVPDIPKHSIINFY